MEIIKLNEVDLESLVREIRLGKTIVYPTETCYGLGCDSTNNQAVEKVFEIKKRQKEKSVLIVVPEVSMIMQYVEWTPTLDKISSRYWPGPLTVVVPVKSVNDLASGVIGQDSTVAFRVTDYPFSFKLSKYLGSPLVSTSANLASEESPYDIDTVVETFRNADTKPDIVIDAGSLPHHSPSTVIRVLGSEVEILRQGEVIVEK